jgi:hypothetical protein
MRIGSAFSVSCRDCKKPIYKRSDLVTAFRWMVIKPFHAACYGRSIRGFRNFFVKKNPTNGFRFTVFAFLLGLLAVVILSERPTLSWYLTRPILADKSQFLQNIMLPLALITPFVMRLYSWIRYEMRLPV